MWFRPGEECEAIINKLKNALPVGACGLLLLCFSRVSPCWSPCCVPMYFWQGLHIRVRKYTSGTPPVIKHDNSFDLEQFQAQFGNEGHPMNLFPFMWEIEGWRACVTGEVRAPVDTGITVHGAMLTCCFRSMRFVNLCSHPSSYSHLSTLVQGGAGTAGEAAANTGAQKKRGRPAGSTKATAAAAALDAPKNKGGRPPKNPRVITGPSTHI